VTPAASSARWPAARPLAVVHFDAHPDTWDQYFGSKLFHGTPFRGPSRMGAIDPKRMIQVGIRGPLYGSEDFDFHAEHGLEVLRIEPIKEQGLPWASGPLGAPARHAALSLVRHRRGAIRPTRRRRDAGSRGPQPRGRR
jgi:hypothetical protein